MQAECTALQAEWSKLLPNESRKPIITQLDFSMAEIIGNRALARFERAQLEEVLRVIAETKSMAEAGRELFAQSRILKKSTNDSDRVSEILSRFCLEYSEVTQALNTPR